MSKPGGRRKISRSLFHGRGSDGPPSKELSRTAQPGGVHVRLRVMCACG